AVLQHHFQAFHVAEARHGGRGKHERIGPLNGRRRFLADNGHDGVDVLHLAPLRDGFQNDERRERRGAVGGGQEAKARQQVDFLNGW
nr:hypothetical protein [Tanacetum cinerariifolium]